MSTKKIVLISSDKKSFEVEEAVALQSKTLSHQLEDGCIDDGIPIPEVKSNILGLVIEYCKKHAEAGSSSEEEDLKKWDAEFVSEFEQHTIYDIICASNYLSISSLLDLTCQTVADMIASCKDAVEIRAKFDIESDYAPGEEEKIRQENRWVG